MDHDWLEVSLRGSSQRVIGQAATRQVGKGGPSQAAVQYQGSCSHSVQLQRTLPTHPPGRLFLASYCAGLDRNFLLLLRLTGKRSFLPTFSQVGHGWQDSVGQEHSYRSAGGAIALGNKL